MSNIEPQNASRTDRPVRILLVSSWQTVNIGDVAHSPGALLAFERFAPNAELTLLARDLGEREREMFAQHLPDVRIVEEKSVDAEPSAAVRAEFERADILVHGSGPALVARAEVEAWRRFTDKPYGFFGVTVDPVHPYPGTLDETARMIESIDVGLLSEEVRRMLDGAAFVYCRDGQTLRYLQSQKIASPVLEFGPDATLIADLAEDDAAPRIIGSEGLDQDGFLCVVPRLRYTPYYRLRDHPPTPEDYRKDAVNAGFVEADLAVLRGVINGWVRSTGRQVLVVPEMSYAVELAQHKLSDFPDDVSGRVRILPYFWSLPEASTIYRRAAAVVSMECHSPLLATAVDVPGVYVRQPTDTIKGQMYADIGLADRIFEVAPDPSAQVLELLGRIVANPEDAAAFTRAARLRARDLLARMVQTTLRAAGDL